MYCILLAMYILQFYLCNVPTAICKKQRQQQQQKKKNKKKKNIRPNSGPLRDIILQNQSNIDCDLSMSFNVKCDSVIALPYMVF